MGRTREETRSGRRRKQHIQHLPYPVTVFKETKVGPRRHLEMAGQLTLVILSKSVMGQLYEHKFYRDVTSFQMVLLDPSSDVIME
jgi:hypothetical protein